ncbi:MAG: MFS transporter, partial [Aeriscardovia aeriphila]|nr:MFS transporter [Aeriscardovia aeriphila]
QTHPGSLNLSNSLNSMSFNTGIALGAAVSGVVYDHVGLAALGAFGAIFAFLAALSSLALLQIGRSMRASR